MAITWRDTNDRKIVEGWLTVRASQVLYKLSEQEIIGKIEGVLKEGKEAVIILARDTKEKALIIKVYKIEASSFQKMQKYLSGDPRFRKVKKDRKSMVFSWCKKEFSNLEKANKVGVRCPKPVTFVDNMLVMEFIGDEKKGILAPELNQVEFEDKETAKQIFDEIIEQLKTLYKKASLVHADISQYNILIYKDTPWLIDLSTAVLKEHPLAEEFLERDVKNICAFFRKLGVKADEDKVLKQITA